MRNQAGMAIICGMVFAIQGGVASAAGRDACSFLSQNRISAILGIAIDAGRNIGAKQRLVRVGRAR